MTSAQPTQASAERVVLADGRALAWAEYGARDGSPVLYFHGGQSSRLDGAQWSELAAARGIRLITIDRPGYGQSDPKPDRRLVDWPLDVAELADALGLERFAVFGLSGGGPHVAAVAHAIPERLTRVAIVSGASPIDQPARSRGFWFPVRVLYALGRSWPRLLRRALVAQHKMLADKERYLARMQQGLPEPDVRWMQANPADARHFLDSSLEGYAHGIEGDFVEWTRIYTRPWGFPLHAVRVPIRLWYGDADRQVPPHMGRYMSQQLGDARLTPVPDAGHLSTIHTRMPEILAYLNSQ